MRGSPGLPLAVALGGRRRCNVLVTAYVGSPIQQVCHVKVRALRRRRAGMVDDACIDGRDDHDVERGLQLPAQSGPHVGERTILRRGKTHGQRYCEPGFRQLANHELVRQGFVLEEAPKQLVEETMLVLRPLGPCRDQVGQLVVTGRRASGPDMAVLAALFR